MKNMYSMAIMLALFPMVVCQGSWFKQAFQRTMSRRAALPTWSSWMNKRTVLGAATVASVGVAAGGGDHAALPQKIEFRGELVKPIRHTNTTYVEGAAGGVPNAGLPDNASGDKEIDKEIKEETWGECFRVHSVGDVHTVYMSPTSPYEVRFHRTKYSTGEESAALGCLKNGHFVREIISLRFKKSGYENKVYPQEVGEASISRLEASVVEKIRRKIGLPPGPRFIMTPIDFGP